MNKILFLFIASFFVLCTVYSVFAFDITENFGSTYQRYNYEIPNLTGTRGWNNPISTYQSLPCYAIGNFCFYQGILSINAFYENQSVSTSDKVSIYNTSYGLNMSGMDSGSANIGPSLLGVYALTDSISLTDESNISFYCGYSAAYNSNYHQSSRLGFIDENGRVVLDFSLSDTNSGSSECILMNGSTDVNCCEYTTFNCEAVNKTYYNKKIGDIRKTCAGANNTLTGIKQIIIFTSQGSPNTVKRNFYFDDLTVTNVYNGSNSLPEINFSLNEDIICLPKNQTSVTVGLNISSFDLEGDSIYYSLMKDSTYLVKDYVTFDDYTYSVSASKLWELEHFVMCDLIGRMGTNGNPNPLFCGPFENTGVSLDKETGKLDSYCNISTSVSDPNEQDKTLFWEWDKYQNYLLGINTSKGCGAYHYQAAIHTDALYYNDSYQGLSFLVRMENDSSLQVDGNKGNFESLSLNRSGGQTDVYVSGAKVLSSHKNQISIRLLFNYDLGTYTLSFANVTNGVYSDDFGQQTYQIKGSIPPHYLYVYGITGTFYLDDIFFYRENDNITFTGTSPESVSFTKAGKYDISLYVTDSAHLNSDFSTYTKSLEVKSGCEGGFSDINTPSVFNPLLEIKNIFGDSWLLYLTGIGGLETARAALWFLFVITLIVFMVVMWFTTGKLDLTMPLFVTSLIFTLIAFLLGFISHLIVFLICLAFSLALPFANSFTGDNNGG